ncbi:predicted protein [Aspergillus nidulans FGSC A4]|uniref:Uncharacterized protein n=1 Tax=Emericella nidulans (strain FGSC A4 / ATCC 38163 / CBS 112.46 / NRRL 194 / M139) TaxID=227321 RepID=Q5BCP3_EMENI|nr:hypothetical protein [Aspergillus nidulans FGSC A4]EAA64807.1 predicted protein [Aspergillus nidulans FGSC A4]CBF85369.1 TPA: hypothetical protein ANIA_01687 [Aspergillus nidulans FGSC A4]|eukprot:XP_659291.1 predicted protein [Aspergillus nidulans FGSC A4]
MPDDSRLSSVNSGDLPYRESLSSQNASGLVVRISFEIRWATHDGASTNLTSWWNLHTVRVQRLAGPILQYALWCFPVACKSINSGLSGLVKDGKNGLHSDHGERLGYKLQRRIIVPLRLPACLEETREDKEPVVQGFSCAVRSRRVGVS